MKQKADIEKDILSSKVSKLQESINSYSDISKLKSQVEAKLESTKKKAEKMKQEMAQMKLKKEAVSSEIRENRLEVEKNALLTEIKQMEERVRGLLLVNESIKSSDSSQMMNEIKSVVLEKAKTYNQSLIGF